MLWIGKPNAERAPLWCVRYGTDGRRSARVQVAEVSATRAAGFPRILALGKGAVVAWTDVEASRVRAAFVTLR